MKKVILLFMSLMLMGSVHAVAAGSDVNLSEFDHLDPKHQVPDSALRQALTYFKAHRGSFKNDDYMVIVDFTKPSSAKRMHVINLKSGAVQSIHTSHGKGSDPKGTGMAKSFSNDAKSNKSSLGIYRTAETYNGKHGFSLRLDGLSPTNSNARKRAVVIHSAKYVSEKANRAGRSLGCLVVDPALLKTFVGNTKQGALVYAWNGK